MKVTICLNSVGLMDPDLSMTMETSIGLPQEQFNLGAKEAEAEAGS